MPAARSQAATSSVRSGSTDVADTGGRDDGGATSSALAGSRLGLRCSLNMVTTLRNPGFPDAHGGGDGRVSWS